MTKPKEFIEIYQQFNQQMYYNSLMIYFDIFIKQFMNQSISIRFRKIQFHDTKITNINLQLKTSDQVYHLTSSRAIKNGIVNLFGEVIEIPIFTKQFIITILDACDNQKITTYPVEAQTVSQINRKVNMFISQNAGIKIIWEAFIVNDQTNIFRRSLSRQTNLSDLLQFDIIFRQEKQKQDTNNQQQLLGDKKYQKRRKSFQIQISDTTSEPEKQQKYLPILLDKLHSPAMKRYNKGKRNNTHSKLMKSLEYKGDYQEDKQTFFVINQCSSGINTQQDIQCKKPPLNIYPQSLDERISHNALRIGKIGRKNQSHSSGNRKSSKILKNVNLKFIITTGVVGALSGWAGGTIN